MTLPKLTGPLLCLALLAASCSSDDDAPAAVVTTEAAAATDTTSTPDSETSDADGDSATTDDSTTDDSTTDDAEPAGDEDAGADGTDAIAVVVERAEALRASLSADELDTLSYDFGDSTIQTSWSNLPACDTNGRAGIRHGNLSDEQVNLVMEVVGAVMSDEGATEYAQIIAADEELGGGDGDVWDADCYYMAFFGEPSTSEPWALQFGGHHYARTVAFENGSTSVTPAFTGVEPRSFELDGETIEPLADEASSMFAIFEALDDDQLAAAEVSGNINGVVLGPGSDTFPASEGLLLSEASDEVRELVLVAVRNWVNDFEASTADELLAEIEAELDQTYIGWSNSIDIDIESGYGRIDGPSVWIEFVNEGGVGGNDIHQHSVYRDKSNDYGSAA